MFSIELPKLQYNLEVSIVGLQTKISVLDLRDSKNDKNLGVITINNNVDLEEVVVKSNSFPVKIELDKRV